ncbi:MAG: GGDEF domain-containing protein [Candidatus Delongbacteria bacterium]|nr:GGDEF domain-containing protein [Candidatus Delongbacteria bacterium]
MVENNIINPPCFNPEMIHGLNDFLEQAQPIKYYLLVLYSHEEIMGESCEVMEQLKIGRSTDNDLVVRDPRVSRHHFKITREKNGLFVTDLLSKNGTYLNHQRIESSVQLKNGDIINAGWSIFRFDEQRDIRITMIRNIYLEAIKDKLTQLFNKQYIINQLLHHISEKANLPFALLMMDIDHFKQVNDTYGHPAGDEALRYVAYRIASIVREHDVAARYGGEEFMVGLMGVGPDQAWEIAERIRTAVAAEPIRTENAVFSLSISIGIAFFPAEYHDMDKLIALADRRLYQAKHGGRNRTIMNTDPGRS